MYEEPSSFMLEVKESECVYHISYILSVYGAQNLIVHLSHLHFYPLVLQRYCKTYHVRY
jgi:hypothetical protein